MSAFLGPIHFWLFHKIELQESLTASILSAFPEQEASVRKDMEQTYGKFPKGELADIIDESNIHGWLQQHVTLAENHLAWAVSRLADSRENKKRVLDAAAKYGSENPLEAEDAGNFYQALQDMLLDGMPCDHVNMLISREPDITVWERTSDLHSGYWSSVNADPALFDEVRTAWVNGMLQNSRYRYICEGTTLKIAKE